MAGAPFFPKALTAPTTTFLFLGAYVCLAACAFNTTETDAAIGAVEKPERGGFYSYVDGQGNVISVSPAADKTHSATVATPEQELGDGSIARAGNTTENSTLSPVSISTAEQSELLAGASAKEASNPAELWAAEDESYITSDQLEGKIAERERQRFVSYPDETGRLTTHSVDVVAARESAKTERERAQENGEVALTAADVVTSWSSIRSDCCKEPLQSARTLNDDSELALNVAAAPRFGVTLDGYYPAQAFRLTRSTKALQVQSWNSGGYLYPQVLFLDDKGVPLARVAQLFTRHRPQTWASNAYLIGEIPVEPGAAWAVFFIDYADLDEKGRLSQEKGLLRFGDQDLALSMKGEAVVRSTSGSFD
jgi:hypothetical protein